jgi:hypothetical protein
MTPTHGELARHSRGALAATSAHESKRGFLGLPADGATLKERDEIAIQVEHAKVDVSPPLPSQAPGWRPPFDAHSA